MKVSGITFWRLPPILRPFNLVPSPNKPMDLSFSLQVTYVMQRKKKRGKIFAYLVRRIPRPEQFAQVSRR